MDDGTKPLRALLGHCYYRYRGGEGASFDDECRLLEGDGHHVTRFVRANDEIKNYGAAARMALAPRTLWSDETHRSLGRLLRKTRPDVAHFQNTFPLISPSAYDACRSLRIPVVQSIQNYRLICPNGLLYRNGAPCEDCVGRSIPLPGVAHACYRDSRALSGVVASMLLLHRTRRTWQSRVDAYMVPSQFTRRKLIEGGLPADRIFIKPNFVPDTPPGTSILRGAPALYVGRLSQEKGVSDLLKAFSKLKTSRTLRVVGDGPDAEALREQAGSIGLRNVEFLGPLSRSEVYGELYRASCLVVPSRCYETFGRVTVEAFRCARPVIVAKIGALAELVREGVTGSTFAPGNVDDLVSTLDRTLSNESSLRQMGAEARHEYELRYTPEVNLRTMLRIYRSAMNRSRFGERDGSPV